MIDVDLDRADLQVVVWEADDAELKAMLREGVDIHAENAKVLGCTRHQAKSFVHGTNYGGNARTMAAAAGVTTKVSDAMQKRWFGAHPGIQDWHERITNQLATTREVRNAFGFRRFYFDRIDTVLPEALAWIPQSTVAIVTNMGIVNLHNNLPEVQVLLQVHDSTVSQYRKHLDPEIRPKIRDQLLITVPYDDPLVIPVGLKISDKSWGDCKDAPWEVQEKVA
jgi:DNA polymerase I-like protein with 3'-5' exonuclease and polymerase domains